MGVRRFAAGVVAIAVLGTAVAVLTHLAAERDDVAEPSPALEPATPVPSAPPAEPHRESAPRHAPAPVAPTATGEAAAGGVRLTGQVLDDEDGPVPGAEVRLFRAGSLHVTGKSDAGGRFTLSCGPAPTSGSVDVGIEVVYGTTRAGWLAYELMEDVGAEDDVGIIEIVPSVPLVVRVEDAAGPVAGAKVWLGSFFGCTFAATETDARGVARFASTPETDAWLFAYAKGRGRGRGEIPDGRDPKVPLVLTISSRTVRVSVVDAATSNPLADERVDGRTVTLVDGRPLYSSIVPPLDLPVTGDTGTLLVPDLGADEAVQFQCVEPLTPREPWRAAGPPGSRPVAQAREIEVRIDVRLGLTLRWRIVPGDVAVPAEGSVVRIAAVPRGNRPTGPECLHVEEGFLVGHGFWSGAVVAKAVAPDGSIARFGVGAEVRFMRPRSVNVRVFDAAGARVPGVSLMLRAAAGNFSDVRTTADDGEATFSDVEADIGVLDITAQRASMPDPTYVGSVNPVTGDVSVEVRLPAEQQVVLHVTTDGERRLPRAWRLMVNGQWETRATADGADVRFTTRVPRGRTAITIVMRADGEGYGDATVEIVPSADGAPVEADLALASAATLFAEYRPPPGLDAIRAPAWLSVWSAEAGQWSLWRDRPALGQGRRPESDGRYRFDAIPPGRYRIRGANWLLAGEPVDVVAGVRPPAVRLDLSKGGELRVRFVGPDDAPLAGAWLGVRDGAGASTVAYPTPRPVEDANFVTVIVPGDRVLRLTAQHASMVPDGERGVALVREPGGEITLRLVPGPALTFTSPPPPGWAAQAGQIAPNGNASIGVRVLAYQGPVEGEPALTTSAHVQVADGRARIGALPPGRYTLWMKLPWGAPITLDDVVVGASDADLGTVRTSRGSTVRLRLDVPPGQSAPRIHLSVQRLTEPAYAASLLSSGEAEIVIGDLGPGRFEVTATAAGYAGTLFTRVVDLDGAREVVIDSSLR